MKLANVDRNIRKPWAIYKTKNKTKKKQKKKKEWKTIKN